MFENILIPLDGSELAKQSIPFVAELAQAFESKVDILGICESGDKEEGQACNIAINFDAEKLQKMLSGTQAKVQTTVLFGKPAREIMDYAQNNEYGLIVITSHGRSGLGPWSLGSTVRKLLDMRPRMPVLVIRASDTPECQERLFSRIIVPLDGSSSGEAALPYIIELAKKIEVEVFLLKVVEMQKPVHTGGGLIYIRFDDRDIEKTKLESRNYLENIAGQFADTKAKIQIETPTGEPYKEIINFSNNLGYCIIAVASHGHSGIDTWIYGSVTYKIVEASKKSLFLVHVLRDE